MRVNNVGLLTISSILMNPEICTVNILTVSFILTFYVVFIDVDFFGRSSFNPVIVNPGLEVQLQMRVIVLKACYAPDSGNLQG